MIEYLRPWKMFTLVIGVALLVLGAIAKIAPDWDIPISLLMALLTYAFAPLTMRIILERRWIHLPFALLIA